MHLIIDESESFKDLYPLTYVRPSYDLVIGALSNSERMKLLMRDSSFDFINRNPLLGHSEAKEEGLVLFSKMVFDKKLAEKISKLNSYKNIVLKKGHEILGFSSPLRDLKNAEEVEIEARLIKRPYDLIRHNKEMLYEDLLILSSIYEKCKLNNVIGNFGVFSNGSFTTENPVFFDTREGPIFIGKNAYLQAFSRIEGPTYIGEDSIIITGSNIRRSYIGKHCTIGGEVTNSVILDYTNSRHQSYIGDSYICSWVNIGAHTVISNMKNTYGEMRYDSLVKEEKTGLRKLGGIIADHVKTSIHTIIYGGKQIGFSSHVLNFLDRSIPSFTIWFGFEKEGYEFDLRSAIETAKRYMESKRVSLSVEQMKIFEKVFEMTKNERETFGVKKEDFRNKYRKLHL